MLRFPRIIGPRRFGFISSEYWSCLPRFQHSGPASQVGPAPPSISEPASLLTRHDIRQTISRLPLADCAREISFLDGLEKARERREVQQSPIVSSLIDTIRREREAGKLAPENETNTNQSIERYRLEEMDVAQEEKWELEKITSSQSDPTPQRAAGDLRRAASEPTPGHAATVAYPSVSRSWALITHRLPQRAAELEDSIETDSKTRCFDYLFKLDMPNRPEDRKIVQDVKSILQRGLRSDERDSIDGDAAGSAHQGTYDQPACSGATPDGHHGMGSAEYLVLLVRQLSKVFTRAKYAEKDIEEAFVGLLNGVVAHVNQAKYGDTLRGKDAQGDALFLCVSRRHSKHVNAGTGHGPDGRDKPDIVCLDEPVRYNHQTQDSRISYQGTRCWGEVKKMAWQDLDKRLFRQHLRYAYRIVTANPMCGRQFGFTLCGQVLRLWLFDAIGYTCTKAIDVTDDGEDNATELAQILLFLTGPSQQLQQRWTPTGDATYFVDVPASAKSASSMKLLLGGKGRKKSTAAEPALARVEVEGALHPLGDSRLGGLWGRRTSVFGGASAVYTEGRQTPGGFQATGSPRIIDLVLKLAWLPEEILGHEHRVLHLLESKGVEDVPRSRGSIRLSDGWETLEAERSSATRAALGFEAQATQLKLLAMALESPTGITIDYGALDIARHVRLFRCLVAKLYELAGKCDLHYRDLNLGNILLHPDWQQRIEENPNANILLLIDFGNARIGNEPRAVRQTDTADSVHLGLEDALSVNGFFMSCRALSRLALEQRLQEQIDLRPASALQAERKRANIEQLLDNISHLDHRYPDDIESAMYCFLVQLLFHCRSSARFNAEQARKLGEMVVFRILQQKEIHWDSATRFEETLARIGTAVPNLEAAVIDGLFTALTAVRAHVYEAQDWPRITSGKKAKHPRRLAQKEKTAFEGSLKALDKLIRSLPPPAASMSESGSDSESAATSPASPSSLDLTKRTTVPETRLPLFSSSSKGKFGLKKKKQTGSRATTTTTTGRTSGA